MSHNVTFHKTCFNKARFPLVSIICGNNSIPFEAWTTIGSNWKNRNYCTPICKLLNNIKYSNSELSMNLTISILKRTRDPAQVVFVKNRWKYNKLHKYNTNCNISCLHRLRNWEKIWKAIENELLILYNVINEIYNIKRRPWNITSGNSWIYRCPL